MGGIQRVNVRGWDGAVQTTHKGLVFGTELGMIRLHAGGGGVLGFRIEAEVALGLAILGLVEEEVEGRDQKRDVAVITDDNDGNIIFEGPGAVSSVASWHATIVSRSQCPEEFAFFRVVLSELGLKGWVELGIQGLAVRCFTGSDKESDGGGGCGLLDID